MLKEKFIIYKIKIKNQKKNVINLKEKIKKLTNSLRGLNIDNQKFNNELLNIYQELYPKIKLNKKINKSFEINENNIG